MPALTEAGLVAGSCAFAEYAWRSDIGRVRKENQDSAAIALASDGAALVAVVADGLGGYEGGRTAADITVCSFTELLERDPFPESDLERFDMLRDSFFRADARVRECDKFPSMGATAVAALVTAQKLIFQYAGDSRCYLIRDGAIAARTIDHSLRALAEAHGPVDPTFLNTSQFANMVTSCIGGPGKDGNLTVGPKFSGEATSDGMVDLLAGDVILLFSDGLWNNVCDRTLVSMAMDEKAGPAEVTERMVAQALRMGGQDNITVAMLRIAHSGHPALKTPG